MAKQKYTHVLKTTDFPKWNPQRNTLRLLYEKLAHSIDPAGLKIAQYKALRNSSSAFISKPQVRSFIFSRDGHKCLKCFSTTNLQIDHEVSIADCIDGIIPLEMVNSKENLKTLCLKCNASKKHTT